MRVIKLGRRDYDGIEDQMLAFTAGRGPETEDELWLVEHEPVYTQGIAGRAEHLHDAGAIPVVLTKRGGQVTYHGPGQVVAYPLVDLQRLSIQVKEYVYRLEQAVLQVLGTVGVTGHRVPSAPGIYVRLDDPFDHARWQPPADAQIRFDGLGKIAALGIKLSRHRSYHGLALNVAMDLEPFSRIDACGYAGLRTVDLRSLGVPIEPDEVADRLTTALINLLR